MLTVVIGGRRDDLDLQSARKQTNARRELPDDIQVKYVGNLSLDACVQIRKRTSWVLDTKLAMARIRMVVVVAFGFGSLLR